MQELEQLECLAFSTAVQPSFSGSVCPAFSSLARSMGECPPARSGAVRSHNTKWALPLRSWQ